jgi:hypothetical protein
MRRMSWQRRRVVGAASSLACMSGIGPALSRHHPRVEWVWLVVYVLLLIWVIVLMVRLGRDEGCE